MLVVSGEDVEFGGAVRERLGLGEGEEKDVGRGRGVWVVGRRSGRGRGVGGERERGRRPVRGKREILRPRMDCGGLGSGEPRREKARN